MATKDTTAKKAIDVAKPGNTTPDASARPVIVTHKPMVKDPMVKAEDSQAETKSTPAPVTRNKVIKPLNETSQDAPDETTEKAPDTTDEKPTDAKPSADEEAAKEAAVIDAVAGQADLGKKNNDPKAEAAKKRQEIAEKLAEEKKYFVPIGQVSKRRNKRLGVVILILLLVAVGSYLALDAGLLKRM